MGAPLEIVIAGGANRYLERQDQKTQRRIRERLANIASDPTNFSYSEPLQNTDCRSAHVGGWRILLRITDSCIQVTDIDRRGQVYRNLKRR